MFDEDVANTIIMMLIGAIVGSLITLFTASYHTKSDCDRYGATTFDGKVYVCRPQPTKELT